MPAPGPLDTTLSILSFNTRDALRRCLRSIGELVDAARVETIVIDNASRDGSAEMVACEFPGVRLVRNATNRYFTRAHNQALALARGRYVGFLNSDTRLFPDTIARMVAFMDARPEAAASTCVYVHDDGTPLRAEFHNYWRFRSVFSHVLCRHAAGERLYLAMGGAYAPPIAAGDDWLETDVVSGTFLFGRKTILDAIGGFDERLLLYATEDDMCVTIKRAGGRVFCYRGARLMHALSLSTRRLNPFRVRWIFARDVIRYHLKHGGALSRAVAVPFLLGAYGLEAAAIASRGGRWRGQQPPRA
jgi:GT2 family glycosyltransferase